ncbi:MAG TPA: c-type cytochrome, partial [Thermodesulfobacteriota bacterium]|nr:c-type cytochrome [Thermodesulfobacteriota bacterium]
MKAISGKYIRVLAVSITLFLLSGSVQYLRSAEENPALKFLVSGEAVKEITLSELKSKLETHTVELYDVEYKKSKRYSGFTVQDVLALGFGDELNNPDFTDIAFTALDGYESVSVLSKMKEKGGYIVFADIDYPDWEPVGRIQASPGPFYLIWTGKDQLPENEYPWPWQIASINIMRFPDQYPLVYPEGAGKDSAAYKGYEIFKGKCVRCHSMNRQGGKVGPDLNAPRSIVTYRSEYMIKEFISHPSQYRYTQMPDHTDLTDQD